jgi:hypothetical protein
MTQASFQLCTVYREAGSEAITCHAWYVYCDGVPRTCDMGFKHGLKSRRDGEDEPPPPQKLQWGDANTGCPPRFLSFSTFEALAMDSSPQISTQIYATGFKDAFCRAVFK